MCSDLFHALKPVSEGEKSLLQHALVPFIIIIIIITLAYLGASQWGEPDPTGRTGHPLGLWGLHLQSQQVLGCIPLLQAGSAVGCAAQLVSASCTGTEQLSKACPPTTEG